MISLPRRNFKPPRKLTPEQSQLEQDCEAMARLARQRREVGNMCDRQLRDVALSVVERLSVYADKFAAFEPEPKPTKSRAKRAGH